MAQVKTFFSILTISMNLEKIARKMDASLSLSHVERRLSCSCFMAS